MKENKVLGKDAGLKFPHALLISASAGSGKTYTLTQRYVQFLLSERVPGNDLRNILAVTFTNNAAKEMKVRILRWLKELALDKNCAKMDETMALTALSRGEIHRKAAELVDRVIADYSDFHIQTIDSFLARVMTASVDELNLPLDPEITMTYEPLIDLALYSLFARIGTDELPAAMVDKFLAVLPKTGSYPWNPADRVRDNFNSFLNQEGKSEGEIRELAGDYEPLLKEKFREITALCAALKKLYKDPALFRQSSLAALEAASPVDFLASYSFTYGILNGQKKSAFPAGWERELEKLHEAALALTELNAQAYYHPYVGIYARFKNELERVKRGKTDVIHISEIAKKLSAYIRKSNVPEIYLKLGERISHFLIDEFQDTNRLQWNVLRPLVEEALSKTGSLFVVGDIKQAIYMFRNADYRIMRDLLDKAEGRKPGAENLSLEPLGGELKYVNLPVNYRSDGEVLAYVNRLFREKLKNTPELAGEDITELTTYEQAVRPARIGRGFVRTDVMEEDESGPEKRKAWLLEAVADARKRYPLNEIAVLVSKNRRIEPVVDWLTGAGVPVASLSSLDIRKRRVVAELLTLLKFLETPSDDLAFASFITGDIFAAAAGASRGEMRDFIFSASNPSGLELTAPPGVHASRPLLYAAFRNHAKYGESWSRYLDPLFRKVGYLPLYELVSLIYRTFGLFGNFPDEQAFLARFLEAVSVLAAEGVGGPKAFVEYASGSGEDRAAVFSIALPEYMDAVRVMTFHKSKGLGFSVVINLMFDEKDPPDPMYFEERGDGIHVYHITKQAAEASVRLRPIYQGRKADSGVQDLNVLYVISTRARHELYNLVVKKTRKTAPVSAKLSDLFEDYRSASAPERPERKETGKPAAPVEIGLPAAERDEAFEISKPTHAGRFETAEGELVHEILSKIGTATYFGEEHRSTGAQGCRSIGAQEHKSTGGGKTEDEVRELCRKYSVKYPFGFDEGKIVKTVSAFLALPEVRTWFEPREGREIFVEAEFIDKSGALFRMDRVIADKDGVTVIDYKTGGEDPDKYSAQMKNYLAITAEVYKKPVRGFLAYVDLGKIRRVE